MIQTITDKAEKELLGVQCALDALALLCDAASNCAPLQKLEGGHWLGLSVILKAMADKLNKEVYGEISFMPAAGSMAKPDIQQTGAEHGSE